jgi:MYXO-CTERM domain-containing protein
MKLRPLLALTITIIAAWGLLPMSAARADQVLYDSAGFIEGQQSFVQSFDITSAETLTISLSQVPWLDTISDLNCFVSTAKGVIGTPMSGGTESMNVGPGMIYVHWFGDANGQYGLGAYGLKIDCGTTPVALPGTLILLLSGLGVLFGWQRRRIDPIPT